MTGASEKKAPLLIDGRYEVLSEIGIDDETRKCLRQRGIISGGKGSQ